MRYHPERLGACTGQEQALWGLCYAIEHGRPTLGNETPASVFEGAGLPVPGDVAQPSEYGWAPMAHLLPDVPRLCGIADEAATVLVARSIERGALDE